MRKSIEAAVKRTYVRVQRSFQNGWADQWVEQYGAITRVVPWVVMARLWLRNIFAREPITLDGGPVVSLTSYGKRLERVFIAIESIAAGDTLPGRVILWIDNDHASVKLNRGLRRLVRRGLEIRNCPNYGPHTKYFPFCLTELKDTSYLVTADDDIMYADWWLRCLTDAFLARGSTIPVGYRVRRIRHQDGVVDEYVNWSFKQSSDPDMLGVITAVSGVAYPKEILEEAVRQGTKFLQVSRSADDLWLAKLAMDTRLPRSQVFSRSVFFWNIPGTQRNALMKINVDQCQNDVIARALFDQPYLKSLVNLGAE